MKAKVISIANQKGGVGKTTTSIELASVLSSMGKRVLVIDLDQQGNLTKYVDADTSVTEEKKRAVPSIYEVLAAEEYIGDAIQKLGDFDVVTSSEALSKADKNFTDATDPFALQTALEKFEEDPLYEAEYDYDYIITDNSPSRNILLTMAYVASDYVVIPTECDEGAIDGIMAIVTDVNKLRNSKPKFSSARIAGIVLNKYENTGMHKNAMENLVSIAEEIAGGQNGFTPFIATVRKGIVSSEAKLFRMPIQELKSSSNVAVDYKNFAEELIKKIEGEG